MGSGFDDWVYWHFFTYKINYNSSKVNGLIRFARFLTGLWAFPPPLWSQMKNLSRINSAAPSHASSLYTFVRTEYSSLSPRVNVTAYLSVVMETWVATCNLAMHHTPIQQSMKTSLVISNSSQITNTTENSSQMFKYVHTSKSIQNFKAKQFFFFKFS
jgi:hypothetical protein